MADYEEAADVLLVVRISDQAPVQKHTWMMEKQRTGEATLLIHMLKTIATNMLVIRTVRGRVPALLRKKVAIIFAM